MQRQIFVLKFIPTAINTTGCNRNAGGGFESVGFSFIVTNVSNVYMIRSSRPVIKGVDYNDPKEVKKRLEADDCCAIRLSTKQTNFPSLQNVMAIRTNIQD